MTEWQQRLKLVYEMAGIPDGHSHRLRDTFSVDLLSRGVSLEIVSKLLGHTHGEALWAMVQAWQTALEAAVKGTW